MAGDLPAWIGSILFGLFVLSVSATKGKIKDFFKNKRAIPNFLSPSSWLGLAGYVVYAVNPNIDEVLSDRYYHSLSLPQKPDVVDTVVPPAVKKR